MPNKREVIVKAVIILEGKKRVITMQPIGKKFTFRVHPPLSSGKYLEFRGNSMVEASAILRGKYPVSEFNLEISCALHLPLPKNDGKNRNEYGAPVDP